MTPKCASSALARGCLLSLALTACSEDAGLKLGKSAPRRDANSTDTRDASPAAGNAQPGDAGDASELVASEGGSGTETDALMGPNAGATGEPESADAGRSSSPALPDSYSVPEDEGDLRIEIGVPDAQELEFVGSYPGGPVPIAGLGQVGLTARLAVRVEADDLDLATIRVELRNLGDESRDPGVNNNADLEQPLDCRDDGYCYPVIQRVEVSHLNRLPELEGTVVSIAVTVVSADNEARAGTAHSWGYFFNNN